MKTIFYFVSNEATTRLFFHFYRRNGQHHFTGKEPSWATLNPYDYADFRLEHEAENEYFDPLFEKAGYKK